MAPPQPDEFLSLTPSPRKFLSIHLHPSTPPHPQACQFLSQSLAIVFFPFLTVALKGKTWKSGTQALTSCSQKLPANSSVSLSVPHSHRGDTLSPVS